MMQSHYLLSPADRAVVGSGSAVLDTYMALRLRYVTGMGWLHGLSSDHDVYDGSADTRYFVRLDQRQAEVSAGMRATRVASLHDSLTWRMVGTTTGTQRTVSASNELLIARLGRYGAEEFRGLWDITRLVAPLDGPMSKAEIVRGVYELFGMALFTTAIEPGADPAWVFLTTRLVKRLLDMSGMEYTTMFSGRVTPTDDYDCYLCVMWPRSLYSLLGQPSGGPARCRALDGVAAGFDAMRSQAMGADTQAG
jgi:hypothetical protein